MLIFAFWETHRVLVSVLVMGFFFLLAPHCRAGAALPSSRAGRACSRPPSPSSRVIATTRYPSRGGRLSDHLSDLALRRAHLQRKAGYSASSSARVRHRERFSGGVGGFLNARFLFQKPALIVGGAALLFSWGPRRVLALAGRALFLFSTAKRLLRLVRGGDDSRE